MRRLLLTLLLLAPFAASAQTTLYSHQSGYTLTASRGAGVASDAQGLFFPYVAGDWVAGVAYTSTDQYGAITLNQAITCNAWGAENSSLANVGFQCGVSYVVGSTYTTICTTGTSTEWGTAASVRTLSCTPNVSVPNGAKIYVTFDFIAVGSNNSVHYTGTLYSDAASAGVNGDSYVTFTQTLPAYVPPASSAQPTIVVP